MSLGDTHKREALNCHFITTFILQVCLPRLASERRNTMTDIESQSWIGNDRQLVGKTGVHEISEHSAAGSEEIFKTQRH